MPKKKFYAVAIGKETGIFETWEECRKQVIGFKGAKYKSFKTKSEAEEFIKENRVDSDAGSMAKEPPAKRQRTVPDLKLRIHINFDGGSRGNPGVAGAGATLTVLDTSKKPQLSNDGDPFRRTIHVRRYLGTNSTNNEAEYQGLICGLEAAFKEATEFKKDDEMALDLIVQGDSDLIIQQLQGQYQCKSEKLKPHYEHAKRLLDRIGKLCELDLSLEHVYRSDNSQADALANQAMDARRSWYTTSDDNHEEQHNGKYA